MPSKKKKKFLVSLAKPDARIKGMDVMGKKRRFSKDGYSFVLNDSGEAKELDREFGQKTRHKDIVVSEIPNGANEAGHRYNFTVRKLGDEETLEERRQRMIDEGWVEFKPGQWKKVAQSIE